MQIQTYSLWRTAIVLVGGIVACQPIIAQQPAAKNYALLVAINEYEDAYLNNPVLRYPQADARAIEQELKGSGYKVDVLLGQAATRSAILQKLEGLAGEANSVGTLVVGFFGHGIEYEESGEAMFIPYDAQRRFAKDADGKQLYEREKPTNKLTEPNPSTLVGMSAILDGIRLSKAGSKLLLADCCRSNPNAARGTRAFGSKVNVSDLPTNMLALFACSEGEKAQEHEKWQHGAMTKCFLDLLPDVRESSGDVNSIVGKLRRNVTSLVAEVDPTAKQTVHPIANGTVELPLRSANQPKLSLIPPRQKLSPEEIAARKQKALRELPNLGTEDETVYIRGKIYGPESLKFKLDDWEKDVAVFFQELAVVFTQKTEATYRRQSKKFRDMAINAMSSIIYTNGVNFSRGTIAGLTWPDQFTVLDEFLDGPVYEVAPTKIRDCLALTTVKERRETFSTIEYEYMADEAIFAVLIGDYDRASRIKLDATHGPYAAAACVLAGRLETALEMANLQKPSYRTGSLLLICDVLLDEGDSAKAAEVYNLVDHKAAADVLCGTYPLPKFEFISSGSVGGYYLLDAYIAGRFNDEGAYTRCVSTFRSNDSFSEMKLRAAFVRGLVCDL